MSQSGAFFIALITLPILLKGHPNTTTQPQLTEIPTTVSGDVSSTCRENLEPYASSEEKTCQCAIFNYDEPASDRLPLIIEIPKNITCDGDGVDVCIELCSDLYKAVEDKLSGVMCAALGHYNHLQMSHYTRACNGNWIHVSTPNSQKICCHEGIDVPCEES